jgi:two-component system, OmpR family, response regulator
MSLQRLAYVDDDADICEIVRFALSEVGGIEVRCWNDGATFLRDVEAGWTPQLVLLDVNMPGMNGWEILAALRAGPRTREWPVVMLSASSGTGDDAASACADVLGCVAKPFDPLRLAEDLQGMWSRHRAGGNGK